MNNILDNFQSNTGRNPWGSFFLLIFFLICGLFVGQLLGFVIISLVFDFNIRSLQAVLLDAVEHPEARIPMYILQGMSAFGAFIAAPFLFIKIWMNQPLPALFKAKQADGTVYILTFFMVIAFMYVNSVFVEWNAQLTLPEFLRPFEEWAYEKEQQAKMLTQFLTTFENFGQFILGIFIIAVIPAIGEELVFRGLIQNQFRAIVKNPHVAIIIASILFSAMHLQFYGFVPRMLLGVLFGYMYYWSKNLWLPIFAHFVNNGFTLTMLYLYQQKAIDYDMESETSVPWYVFLPGLVIGTALLYYFWYYFMKRRLVDE